MASVSLPQVKTGHNNVYLVLTPNSLYMEWFVDLLKHYPELAIFLTLAFGFWIGKFKIGKF